MARKSIINTANEGEDALSFFLRELSAGLYYEGDEQSRSTLSTLPDSSITPLEWALRNRSLDGRPFTLDLVEIAGKQLGFVPLKQIYDDDHPNIVIQKPARRGVSELAICKACHALDVGARFWKTGQRGVNVGYLFPTDSDVSYFAKERFTGIQSENEYMAGMFHGTDKVAGYDDVHFKQAGYSYLHLRGTESERRLKGWDADFLIFDEFDEMISTGIALAEKRLGASLVNRRLTLSTPKLPGKGINALYLRSDQHVWETPCLRCGLYNQLDFFRDVFCNGDPYDEWKAWDEERLFAGLYTVHCPNCSDQIPDEVRYTQGQWIALRPDIAAIRGYLIPALCFPSCKLHELGVHATSEDPTVIEEFYRSDLGIPYDVVGSRVTEDMLKQLSAELVNGLLPVGPWHTTTLGMDVGRRIHFKITSTGPGGFRYTRVMGTLRSDAESSMWEKADELMKQYHVRRVVVDAAPEWDACERWARSHPGIVYRAIYLSGKHALEGSTYRITASEEEKKRVKEIKKRGGKAKLVEDVMQVNRTKAMDAVYAVIAKCEERWPAYIHNDREVVSNMCAPSRVVTLNDNGEERPSWEHTSPDHFFHACVYDRIAYLSLPKSTGGFHPGAGTKGWGG